MTDPGVDVSGRRRFSKDSFSKTAESVRRRAVDASR